MTITLERRFAIRGPRGFLCKQLARDVWERDDPRILYIRQGDRPKLQTFNTQSKARQKVIELGRTGLKIVEVSIIDK